MYKNILVPVAFDDHHDGHRGVAASKVLASPGARITLLHVMDEVPGYALSYLPEDFRSESRAAVIEALESYAKDMEDGQPVVVEGNPGRKILEFAEDHGCDCIVISSHRPGLQDYFLGSTASRVVRHASCAVHVIR